MVQKPRIVKHGISMVKVSRIMQIIGWRVVNPEKTRVRAETASW